jgi:phosphopantothenoylcysteine decarboxylase / phosphopantothenate---cysteine ligase
MAQRPTVVFGVTGSIAAFKAAQVVSRLVKEGCAVKVVMTAAAEKFVTPLTFQALSGHKVYRDMFDEPAAWDVEHVSLAECADVVVIAPATANVIGRLAQGLCDDLLTCVATATKAPLVIAPAMNDGMYKNPAVQANIALLKQRGAHFIGPAKGRLACGREGVGRMSEVEEIVRAVLKIVR